MATVTTLWSIMGVCIAVVLVSEFISTALTTPVQVTLCPTQASLDIPGVGWWDGSQFKGQRRSV